MTIKMLIDATHEEETRVAIVHGNRVEEFDYESSAKKQIKGNIYLAKITRVEPSLQAAFVEYGGNRHGFLAFSEIHPDYYQIPVSDREELIAEESAAYSALLEEEEEVIEKKPKRSPRRKSRKKSEKKSDGEVVEKSPETTDKDDRQSEKKVKGKATKKPSAKESTKSDDTPETIDPVESDGAVDTEETIDPIVLDDAKDDATTETNDDGSDEKTTTKAESIGEADTLTEEITPDDLNDDVTEDDNSNADNSDDEEDETETAGSNTIDDEEAEEKLRIKIAKGLRRKYKIQEVIKKNQVVLIQVVKEERGNKGAALTTYLSLPGRYCVLMPNTLHGGGVSRKIANASERKSLKKIIADLDMPSGIACIIRTAGQSRTKTEIKRDFDYLIRTWEGIRERTLKSVAPVLINEEGDLIKRSIRDLYTREIDEILVEGEKGYKTARNFMKLLMPSHARKIKHYTESIPLLHKFQVESQLDSMYSPIVQLKSGGYIVINPTEALVSIDVNSGKATKEHNIEETARKTNLEAAEEVARQLRLRDMAGLVVIDFIDMEVRSNNRAVEQKMKECLKSDRARIQVGRISSFGLMEMSRQRLRAGVLESSTRTCPHCEGSGVIRSVETQVLHILRALEDEGIKKRNKKVTIHLPEQSAIYLLNNKRAKLVSLEEQYDFAIEIAIDSSLTESSYRLDLPQGDNKPHKQNPARQGKTSGSDQRDARNKNTSGRDRQANSRTNRQRNQDRKKKELGPKEDHLEKNTSSNSQEQDSKTVGNVKTTDNQESKTRRRRRRPRRSNRNQPEATPHEENITDATSPTESDASGKTDGQEANSSPIENNDDKPKRRRRPRKSSPKAEKKSDPASETKSSSVEKSDTSSQTSDTTTDKKSNRRPYPPQARSRRKSENAKSSSDTKPQKTENEKSEVKADNQKPAKEEKVESKETGPKKTGWWSRTFG